MTKTISSNEYRVLVDWLIKKRLDNNYTMRDLASRLGKPHSFIGKVEQMERRLDVVEYIKYCNALKVDPIEGIELVKDLKHRKL